MKPITITLESETGEFPGTFMVQQGDKLTNGLSWDEMLGQIASITIGSIALRLQQNGGAVYPMRTQEDWDALQRAADERRRARTDAEGIQWRLATGLYDEPTS